MKKLLFILAFAALEVISFPSSAQVGKTIPKLEFSVGGGAGVFGYVASIEKDSWFDRMNIAGKEQLFGPHEDLPWGSAHGGFYMDYHFTDHWGLSSGLEFAFYEYEYTFPGNVFSVSSTTVWSGRGEVEVWTASQNSLYESQRVFSLQIPIMVKYMVPVSRAKGHQYYVAAGVKLGFHLRGQNYIEMDDARYQFLNHITYPDQEINPDKQFAHIDGVYTSTERGEYYQGWEKTKYNPVDVLTGIDTGFRWNLGRGMGLYTGFFCDFGLLRPIALQPGKKIINYDTSQISLLPEAISFDAAEKISIFAAEAPDLYVKGDSNTPEYIHNDKPYIKSLHNLSVGIKLRFAFGLK